MDEASCKPCEAGTYAVRTLNYTSFSPIPTGFDTYCKTFWWSDCDSSDGWIGTEDMLLSGYNLQDDVLLYVERTFNFVQETAYVQFLYSLIQDLDQNNWIVFEIDGRVIQVLDTPAKSTWSEPYNVAKGEHTLKWIYFHSEESTGELDIASIERILVFGADEGGAEY